ncbi:hypothetical protein TI39_contig336g00027 [Zymoseptoria brevis]|uniref:Uncharacterized protein n=1 Tax=Zymoseptoria brevis TaxID=1047168 RepID=A0A0F4GS68_9PEZI|nr:hypothetical protein TI39_contig336g00027 [Zymoseptoria brevis]
MAVNQPLDLTCGIEIECLVLISTPPDQSKYTAVHHFQGQGLIHEALSKPIDVRCATCGVSHDFVLDLNPYMEQTDDEGPEYTKWTVDTDESLDLTVAESLKFHGTLRHVQVFPIEIKSRVLSLTRNFVSKGHAPSSGHTHKVSFDAEVDAVYRSLDRHFNSADSAKNIGLVVNHTCSTHVHIGNGRHGFPTRTVKNVLSLCVAHERLIDNLHSTSRIHGSTILSASESWASLNHSFRYLQHVTAPKVYNSPWSTHFAHTAFLQSESAVPDEGRKFVPEPVYPASRFEASPDLTSAARRFDVPSWLSIITSAQDITDLRNLQQNSARRSTINLHNLQSYRLNDEDSFDFGYRKMTIEFRQHAGTL